MGGTSKYLARVPFFYAGRTISVLFQFTGTLELGLYDYRYTDNHDGEIWKIKMRDLGLHQVKIPFAISPDIMTRT